MTRRPSDTIDIPFEAVVRSMEALYIGVAGAHLRDEDRRKARQVHALLGEVARALAATSRRAEATIVDAAAGKAYVGLLALALVVEPMGRRARVVAIERDAARVDASARAAGGIDDAAAFTSHAGDIADARLWPDAPTLVIGLHACGAASDAIIDRAIAHRAHTLLLVPCCTSRVVLAGVDAEARAEALGLPRHAPVRRRFAQALVDAERTWRLEAAGYQVEVVEFVGALVTPYNLLWRARRVGEPRRMAVAVEARARLLG